MLSIPLTKTYLKCIMNKVFISVENVFDNYKSYRINILYLSKFKFLSNEKELNYTLKYFHF